MRWIHMLLLIMVCCGLAACGEPALQPIAPPDSQAYVRGANPEADRALASAEAAPFKQAETDRKTVYLLPRTDPDFNRDLEQLTQFYDRATIGLINDLATTLSAPNEIVMSNQAQTRMIVISMVDLNPAAMLVVYGIRDRR